MQCSSVFFSQAIPGVLQGYQSCCSSSPGHTKAVKARMAEKHISELTHCWYPRLCTEYVAPLPCNNTNVTEIQTDFKESLMLTLQEKTWPLDTCGQFLLLSIVMHWHQMAQFSTQSRKDL